MPDNLPSGIDLMKPVPGPERPVRIEVDGVEMTFAPPFDSVLTLANMVLATITGRAVMVNSPEEARRRFHIEEWDPEERRIVVAVK